MAQKPRFPGVRVTANGNQLVSYHTEARIADAGVFYPITPSTEGGELYQQAFAEGKLQQDAVYRRHLRPEHRAYVPDFGVYIRVQGSKGDVEYRAISRQLVLFCVERRKAWRMLQSKAGIENREYQAQRAILAEVEAGTITKDDLFANAEALMQARMSKPAAHAVPTAPAAPLAARA